MFHWKIYLIKLLDKRGNHLVFIFHFFLKTLLTNFVCSVFSGAISDILGLIKTLFSVIIYWVNEWSSENILTCYELSLGSLCISVVRVCMILMWIGQRTILFKRLLKKWSFVAIYLPRTSYRILFLVIKFIVMACSNKWEIVELWIKKSIHLACWCV